MSNNLIEHLAELISIWLHIIETDTEPCSCILALSENLSAIRWIHKSNSKENSQSQDPHVIVRRKLATFVIKNGMFVYSQQLLG